LLNDFYGLGNGYHEGLTDRASGGVIRETPHEVVKSPFG